MVDSDDEPTDFDPYFMIVKTEPGYDGNDGKGGQASKVIKISKLNSKVFEIPDDDDCGVPTESRGMAQPVESLPITPPNIKLEKEVMTPAISGTSVTERIKLIKLPGLGLYLFFFSHIVR